MCISVSKGLIRNKIVKDFIYPSAGLLLWLEASEEETEMIPEDLKTKEIKMTKPWKETDHINLSVQIDRFPYSVRIALSEESISYIKNYIDFLACGPGASIDELEEATRRVFELMKDRIR